MDKMQPHDAAMFSNKVSEIVAQFIKSPLQQLSLDIIKNCTCLTNIGIITYLLEYVNNSPKLIQGKKNINCKMKYYYTILCFIVNTINYLYVTPNVNYYDYLYTTPTENNNKNENYYNNMDKLINNKLLYKLSGAYNGNKLLQNLVRLKYLKRTHILNNYILYTGGCGTFETFVWWVNFINNNMNIIISKGLINQLLIAPIKNSYNVNVMFIDSLKSSVNLEELVIKSIINADNRIFIYLLKEYKINNELINFTDELIKKILNILNTATFETKYILKRLKLLSEYVNITHLFDYIISSFGSSQVILTLHKFDYYSKPHSFSNIGNIVFKLYLDNMNNEKWYIKKKFNNAIQLFKTNGEREMALLCYLIINEIKKNCIRKKMIFDKLSLVRKYETIINMIIWNQFLRIINWDKFIKGSSIYTRVMYNIIGTIASHAGDENNIEFPFFTHLTGTQHTMFLKINRVLYRLRCILKRRYYLNFNKKLNTLSPIIIALKQHFNQLQFDHFIKKPTVMFSDINKNMYIMGNINYMRIIVLQSSTLSLLPYINSSYQVKIVEFDIDDITIYGIIDINIPHTTYNERCRVLLNAHPFKQNNRINIDSLETYKKEIETNCENIIKYVNENKDNISFLWWPLIVYKYTGTKQTICKDFIKNNELTSLLYYQDVTII